MDLMLKYIKKYKLLVLLDIVAVFSFALVELGIPTVVSKMIDNGIVNNDVSYIYKMGVVIITLAVCGGLGFVLLGFCSSRISTYVTRDIRNDLFKKCQSFSHSEYSKFGVSSLITRTTTDAFQLLQFMNILLRMAMMTPVMMIVSVIMTVRTSLDLSYVTMSAIPCILIGVFIIARTSKPISTKQQSLLDKLNRITRENLTGIRVIRAFIRDDYETERFEKTNEDYSLQAKKLFKLMSITQPIFFLILNISVIGVFWVASNKIDLGQLKVGELVAFLEYQFHLMFSTMLFSMVFVMYPKAEVSARRINEILKTEPIIKNPANGITSTEIKGLVKFENVNFQYPDGEIPVLKNLSFTANKGEMVAFIGSTGSGKSTLINLLTRSYDITGGSIKIDGYDVREYDLDFLRKKIGFIPQKSFLFKGTIKENIKFGNENATDEEVERAAKIAQAYAFISEKPNKFEEEISEGGTNVSGGQRQRLSIARAIVRNPEIYIFDDSFSALDYKTDAVLRSELKKVTQESIVFVVAQRISSIMNADKIIVLNEGSIVGIGTHKELLKTCDIYKEIAQSQLSQEELANE